MTPSKGNSSFSNYLGERHNGSYSCSSIRHGGLNSLDKVKIPMENTQNTYAICICPLYKVSNCRKKFSYCMFFVWVDQIVYINLKNNGAMDNVVMGGSEVVTNISSTGAADNVGFEYKPMELQNKIDLLEI
ncbi:hypothetical protein Ahy_B02g058348 [Arachis hypogaea]|uniref:Uncharacterized protein n=1 Tax=Arachis hypogaea TaxID=3818 RepID=A0A445AEH0_ARAHY|nr:hypothetical protein Ahy_B02g058348 [Arachis hypogaea]